MREVTKAEFFATIGPQNVHPRAERDVTYWETPTRQLVGKSTPGYLCRDALGRWTDKKTYFLVKP